MPAPSDNNLKARLCIAINDTWLVSFLHFGFLTCDRGQYVIFQIGLKKWGLMNIYAPNHARDRAILWKNILSQVPSVDHWAIAGDFNMLEDVSDRSGGILNYMNGTFDIFLGINGLVASVFFCKDARFFSLFKII